MTTHLSPQDHVEQLEGTLSASKQRHFDACDDCRRQAADLRQLLSDVRTAANLPEPSPLFWDHFSQRVRAATRAEPLPALAPWWRSGWRPLVAGAGVLTAVVLTVMLRTGSTQVSIDRLGSDVPAGHVVADAAGQVDEESLTFVANVAATMPYDEVRQLAQPTSDATDALVAQLTPQQRLKLARLVQAEMRGGE